MDRLAADRMFVEVVRRGGFSAAAARLGCSPGQASRLVSRLEAHLGVRLLNRSTRALGLTPEGETYLARITTLLDELTDLDDSLRHAGGAAQGLLRLTAPLSFGTVQLMPALTDFARAHPGIALDVDFTDSLVSLSEQGFDLAIRVGQPRDSALVARRLGVMRVLTLAAPAYLAARGTPSHPSDLPGHDIVSDTNFARPDDWSFEAEGRRQQTGLGIGQAQAAGPWGGGIFLQQSRRRLGISGLLDRRADRAGPDRAGRRRHQPQLRRQIP